MSKSTRFDSYPTKENKSGIDVPEEFIHALKVPEVEEATPVISPFSNQDMVEYGKRSQVSASITYPKITASCLLFLLSVLNNRAWFLSGFT